MSSNQITNAEKLKYCADTGGQFCREHFYNGHNGLGIEECWCLADAKLGEKTYYPHTDSHGTVTVETLTCFWPQRNLERDWVKEAGLA